MNRQQLFKEVLEDLNREDKVDRLPGWLAGAEFRINGNLRVTDMVKNAVLKVTEMIFPVPPDFQAVSGNMSIHSGSDPATPGPVVGALAYFPADQIDNGLANPASWHPRPPRWFTTRGRNIELGNWNLAGDYLVNLWYYADLMKLQNDFDTNWLLEKAPHIYKSMMLHFGFSHLQEFDTADRFLSHAMMEIQAMNDRSERDTVSNAGPLIMRPTKGFGSNIRRHGR